MIKVAFWYDRPIVYSGGLNYIKNLLYAISVVNDGRVSPYLFLGRNVSAQDAESFAGLATVIRTPILDRMSGWWALNRFLVKYAGCQFLVSRELRKHGIEVVSHAEHAVALGASLRVVCWFPDFQFLHLPDLFPGLDVKTETLRLRRMMSRADAIVVSSRVAFEDLRSIAPTDCLPRARVLQFVSQPEARLLIGDNPKARATIEQKYEFSGRYFYLPNQFWKHKNHWSVFRAVAQLKERGVDVLIICTGNLRDYRVRDTGYVDELREFIVREGLNANIRILGLIPYEDVLFLMRNALAVLNPSRFEGWSSTVEEAKSIGKSLVLSDIPVHREQDPARAHYFDPDDVLSLSSILESIWRVAEISDTYASTASVSSLRERTRVYGEGYITLLEEVHSGRLRHN